MGDGCADLGFDIVADTRDAAAAEFSGPIFVGNDEAGDAVDESDACIEGSVGVMLSGAWAPTGM